MYFKYGVKIIEPGDEKKVSSRQGKLRAYIRRNKLLKRLGFTSYKAYLATDLWKRIRDSHLKSHPLCFGCGRTAKTVHHGQYTPANLLGHTSEHLYSICHGCHERIEFHHRTGRKLTPKAATKQLKRKHKRTHWTPSKFAGSLMYSTYEDLDAELRSRLEREP
jgi:hypothetical protein